MNQFWQGGSGLGVEKWCDVIGWEKTHFIKINLALCVNYLLTKLILGIENKYLG